MREKAIINNVRKGVTSMKWVVLSDIHSNFTALEACLSEPCVQSADGFLFLGDYVTDCPYPRRTTALVRRLAKDMPCVLLRGNREDYLLDYDQSATRDWHYGAEHGSLLYTYENLTREDLAFYRSLPTCTTLFLRGAPPLALAHGSFSATRELLLPERENSIAALTDCPVTVYLCGHSHKQFLFRHENKQLINPGSVGLPIAETSGARFALLELIDGAWHAELHRVSYDTEPLLAAFDQSGLKEKAPIWTDCIIASLRSGKDLAPSCARLARKLAAASHESNSVSAPFWREAARQLGVL